MHTRMIGPEFGLYYRRMFKEANSTRMIGLGIGFYTTDMCKEVTLGIIIDPYLRFDNKPCSRKLLWEA